jgi:glycosyltransferase involved in cell wall biosynthesis
MAFMSIQIKEREQFSQASRENWQSKLLVIIPAYNEEDSVGHVINQIKAHYPQAGILVVNDGSKDSTESVAQSHNARVVTLPMNCGIGVAMRVGYRIANEYGYEMAIQVDADGQHDPRYIGTLAEPILNRECDMVIGSRFLEKKGFVSSMQRRVGIRFFSYLLFVLTGKWFSDPTSGNRVVNRKVIELFATDYPSDYPEPESLMMLAKKSFRVKEIPIIMDKRQAGKSSISFTRAVYYMIKVTFAILARNISR